MQNHASRIKVITEAIRAEKAKVLAAHGACIATKAPTTKAVNVTSSPALVRTSAGAMVSAGVMGIIAVVAAVMML